MESEKLIPKHGGYRKLKSFQIAQLIYDVTVRFADRYIDKFSRSRDQMVQAARSGVQNIAEGSQASGTSKKTELKLTNVARASLEELRLDYEDFLRQRGLSLWRPNHPSLKHFKARRCSKMDDVLLWLKEERNAAKKMDKHRHTRTNAYQKKSDTASVIDSESPCESVPDSVLVANAALSLLNLCCYLLDRQLAAQADTFEKEGGFTERLYRIRQQRRRMS
ncbi:MAG: four helix bundle protein [Sedimentisphaerales bacterium]|nr:four helix bundle protein [Sedimentisphaerales bacterium]